MFCPHLRRLIITAAVLAMAANTVLAQSRQALDQARQRMVDSEIVAAGVKNARVIEAMRTVPRHEFMPLAQRPYAYYDMALPIGESQTISPPFIVASMTEAIDPQPTDKVLEIGTGSGYQAAVLSGLVSEVYTIEIVPALGRQAAKTLKRLGYDNVSAKVGDGFLGWPEHAPFDKIIVTCSPEKVPVPLAEQLKEGGQMVIPVGERYQQVLYLVKKVDGKLQPAVLKPTLFVPMTGEAENRRQVKPDPANPTVRNGDFEEALGDAEEPAGWHYLRQGTLVVDGSAASGKNFLKFTNSEPGRGAHALQGLPIDGRVVKQIQVSLSVRGEGIRSGQTAQQLPRLIITYYDENRAEAGHDSVGPWRGTFEWEQKTAVLDVPIRAREAIVRIGMDGALGEISFDDVAIRRLP
jgi:protein-L-isoaspartate(D-aspartate) O-methyltransferase